MPLSFVRMEVWVEELLDSPFCIYLIDSHKDIRYILTHLNLGFGITKVHNGPPAKQELYFDYPLL